jgi:hypothetical protein
VLPHAEREAIVRGYAAKAGFSTEQVKAGVTVGRHRQARPDRPV